MPDTSSSVRGRPKRLSSISGSQVRKRGQARVHRVQPFSAVGAVVGPAVGQDVERLVVAVGVVVAEDVVGTGDDAGGTAGTQARSHDFGEELGPLWLFGWHEGPPYKARGGRSGTVSAVPEILEVELYRQLAEKALGRTITKVWMVDSRYGRGGTTPRRLSAGAGRACLHGGPAEGQAHAARHR